MRGEAEESEELQTDERNSMQHEDNRGWQMGERNSREERKVDG
jgi:hypothetical protein